ncbi:OLC1v1014617C2 [Oldenlandia corymbosa var. corymbosa]|uniref:OLC1v1014617C2 n=1 Tax=Oldenlandia corymbosa var. corymbosa TaxID=529605 RepID=A0AAV1E386_OLDCO|nr:OLC1v1014617C2 [Oldenlandia corymbosa var. corymbosa]
MKKIWIFIVPILVFCSPLVGSYPADVKPAPPVSDPVLPTEKDPVLPSSSSSSPGEEADAPAAHVVHHQDINKKILTALIIAATLLGATLLLASCFWFYRTKKLKSSNSEGGQKHSSDVEKELSAGQIFDKVTPLKVFGKKGSISFIAYPVLVAATNNFQESNIIGEGGLGCVYKGQFQDNLQAAIKKLNAKLQDSQREFENEVDLLGRIRHQNIVPLLGYSVQGETRFLVYEMMQNGSLESHLHGPSRGSSLTWHLRMKIALDVARGLEYLHERCNPPVIHRDLKSSNILLDSKYNAKLSDFGLAITGGNLNKKNVKLSGTLGYVAPEYLLDGKLTEKSDVYAFGVVLLELIIGRKPVEKISDTPQSLVTWAMPQLTDRTKLPGIVDPVIRNTMDLKHLYQVFAF